MASSGVTVQDAVVSEFNNIKIGHKYQYVQMKLTNDWKEIEVEKTVDSGAETFSGFVGNLPPNDCRYIVYDFHFDTGKAGHREQLIFILWCPETSTVKTKMLYAPARTPSRRNSSASTTRSKPPTCQSSTRRKSLRRSSRRWSSRVLPHGAHTCVRAHLACTHVLVLCYADSL